MGMEPGDPLPVDVERISKETMVGEVVMKQEETPLLKGCSRKRVFDPDWYGYVV